MQNREDEVYVEIDADNDWLSSRDPRINQISTEAHRFPPVTPEKTFVHGLIDHKQSNCRICAAILNDGVSLDDLALGDARAFILHLNNGIAVLISLWLKPLFCYRQPLTNEDAFAITECYLSIASRQIVRLGRLLRSQPPELDGAIGRSGSSSVKQLIKHLFAVRDWLDAQIETCVDDTDVKTVHSVHPEIERLREFIGRFVDIDRVLRCEQVRVTRILHPTFSIYTKAMLILSSLVYLYSLRSDWLVAVDHFLEGRTWQGCVTLIILHLYANYVVLMSNVSYLYVLLPIVPVVNNWKLYDLGLSMADTASPPQQRKEDRRVYRELKIDTINLMMSAATGPLLQFLVQSQTLLRFDSTVPTDDTLRSWLAGLMGQAFLVRSIISNLIVLCWSATIDNRNSLPEKSFGVRGAVSIAAGLLYTVCFWAPTFICFTLMLWQCPWYIAFAGYVVSAISTGLKIQITNNTYIRSFHSKTAQFLVEYRHRHYSECTTVSTRITAKSRIPSISRRFVIRHWADAYWTMMSTCVLLGLYALYTPAVLLSVVCVVVAISVTWLVIFIVNMKVDIL